MLTAPRRPWPRLQAGLDAVVMGMAFAGVASLLIEHGFYRPPAWSPRSLLWVLQVLIAAGMLAERIIRCAIEQRPWAHLKSHWHIAAAPVGAVAAGIWIPTSVPPTMLTVKVYIVASLAIRGVGLYAKAASSGIHPSRLLVGSFLFAVAIGAGLLSLPRAVPAGVRPLYPDDAMFTATSATCVTGLIVRDTGSEFSRFGQTVILCLIQLGGLGIMTFGTLFVMLGGRALGLKHQAAMGEALSEEPLGKITRTVKFVVLMTLITELIGAFLLRGLWADRPDGWFFAMFHSISAFCNAGFSLQADSFTAMRDTWRVLLAVPALIIVGGVGFPVLMDVLTSIPAGVRYSLRVRRPKIGVPRPRLTLHTKLVLTATVVLLVFGAAGVVLVEIDAVGRRVGAARQVDAADAEVWGGMGVGDRVRQGWFQAVSARTAGFNTFDLDGLSPAGKMWMIGLMTIGGSPASTAGGVKTVTVAVLLLLVWAALRGRRNVEVFGRTLTEQLLRRAVALAILFFGLICVTTLLLAVFQGPRSRFIDVLFESVSACGTVGLSLGETARLHTASKFVIIAAMFIGRVGPLTLLMALTAGGPPPRYRYPSENLLVG